METTRPNFPASNQSLQTEIEVQGKPSKKFMIGSGAKTGTGKLAFQKIPDYTKVMKNDSKLLPLAVSAQLIPAPIKVLGSFTRKFLRCFAEYCGKMLRSEEI